LIGGSTPEMIAIRAAAGHEPNKIQIVGHLDFVVGMTFTQTSSQLNNDKVFEPPIQLLYSASV
jgi:hypothetical protein